MIRWPEPAVPWLAEADAAAALGISRSLLRAYRRRGILPAVRGADGRRRFPRAEVLALAAQRGAPTLTEVAHDLGLSLNGARCLLARAGVPVLSGPGARRYDPAAVASLLAARTAGVPVPWHVADLRDLAAQIADLFQIDVAALAARGRDARAAQARRALIWVATRLGIPVPQVADLVGRRADSVRRTASLLGVAPSFAPALERLLDHWQARRERGAQRAALDAALAPLGAARASVGDYVRCRLLGERHVQGRCGCVRGLYHARQSPDVVEAIRAALRALGQEHHLSRIAHDLTP